MKSYRLLVARPRRQRKGRYRRARGRTAAGSRPTSAPLRSRKLAQIPIGLAITSDRQYRQSDVTLSGRW